MEDNFGLWPQSAAMPDVLLRNPMKWSLRFSNSKRRFGVKLDSNEGLENIADNLSRATQGLGWSILRAKRSGWPTQIASP